MTAPLATLACTKVKAERYQRLLAAERHRAAGRRRRQGRLSAGQGRCRHRPHQSGLYPHHRADHRTHRRLLRDRRRAGDRPADHRAGHHLHARSHLCRCRPVQRRTAGAGSAPSRPAASARATAYRRVSLKLDDGSPYPLERQAAIHRRDGGSRHRRGAAARHLPQSRWLAAAGPLCPRHRHRGRRSARHPGAAGTPSATTRRASPPRWWSTTRISRACGC